MTKKQLFNMLLEVENLDNDTKVKLLKSLKKSKYKKPLKESRLAAAGLAAGALGLGAAALAVKAGITIAILYGAYKLADKAIDKIGNKQKDACENTNNPEACREYIEKNMNTKKINVLNQKRSQCGKTKNPQKCNEFFNNKIQKKKQNL